MIICDIETTGTKLNLSAIIEIAAIDFEDPSRVFYSPVRANASADIHPNALAVNGTSFEEVIDPSRPLEDDVLRAFYIWLTETEREITFAGINPTFDRDFLDRAFKRAGYLSPLGYRVEDLHSVVYFHYRRFGWTIPVNERGNSSLHSDLLMAFCGMPPEPKPHKAMNGAWYEAEAFHRCFYGTYLYPEFAPYPVPEYLQLKEPF